MFLLRRLDFALGIERVGSAVTQVVGQDVNDVGWLFNSDARHDVNRILMAQIGFEGHLQIVKRP